MSEEVRIAGRPRSLRFALIGFLAFIVGVPVVILGMRVPNSLIEPGIESFIGEERKIAEDFYS